MAVAMASAFVNRWLAIAFELNSARRLQAGLHSMKFKQTNRRITGAMQQNTRPMTRFTALGNSIPATLRSSVAIGKTGHPFSVDLNAKPLPPKKVQWPLGRGEPLRGAERGDCNIGKLLSKPLQSWLKTNWCFSHSCCSNHGCSN